MKRKNLIIVRPCFGYAIYSLIVAIFLLCYMLYIKDIQYYLIIFLFFCISIFSYNIKTVLDLNQLDSDILKVKKGLKSYYLDLTHLNFVIFVNVVILSDGKNKVYLEKSNKLIRELKNLGVIEKELV